MVHAASEGVRSDIARWKERRGSAVFRKTASGATDTEWRGNSAGVTSNGWMVALATPSTVISTRSAGARGCCGS